MIVYFSVLYDHNGDINPESLGPIFQGFVTEPA
jgi:hypothetical protein